ncbi:exopolysaccharide production repressor protein [Allorhizobium pseudoryzae]|uniref:exopolysaccharide production repressor protein n=1 Tax=Allorhizobium pseudoryzae TaxID=379684 RepID=UPI003D074322
MYGPRALISMLAVLMVFAGVTFVLNGSIATTLWQTVLCAIIIQVGYFIGVLALVRKESRRRRADPSAQAARREARQTGEMAGEAPPRLKARDR